MPKNFLFLLLARFFFNFGVSMQAVLLGWRMYELTHDPLYLGFIGLSEAIPALGLALFAGLIVDHTSPLWTYRAVLVGSLISGIVLLTHHDGVLGLFTAAFITGVSRSFSQPSVFAMIPKIIHKEKFSRSNAWLTASLQVARISGPALGGLMFAAFGIEFTAGVVCAGLLIALLSTGFIDPISREKKISNVRESISEKLLSGVKFVFRHPVLFPAMSLDMVSVLFGGVTALLPIYAAEILFTGANGLGFLRASPAIGAALMSLVLVRFEIIDRAGKYLLYSVAGFGFSILVFSVSKNFALSAFALALSGAFDSVSMVIRGTAVQLFSPDNMRGRISAVNSIFIGSSNELGELESGIAAKLMGTVPSAVFGSVVCLFTVGIVALLSPSIRKLNFKKV